MKRIVNKTKSFKEAEEWNILQHIQLTPEERQTVAATLRMRVYGKKPPDIREVYRVK